MSRQTETLVATRILQHQSGMAMASMSLTMNTTTTMTTSKVSGFQPLWLPKVRNFQLTSLGNVQRFKWVRHIMVKVVCANFNGLLIFCCSGIFLFLILSEDTAVPFIHHANTLHRIPILRLRSILLMLISANCKLFLFFSFPSPFTYLHRIAYYNLHANWNFLVLNPFSNNISIFLSWLSCCSPNNSGHARLSSPIYAAAGSGSVSSCFLAFVINLRELFIVVVLQV